MINKWILNNFKSIDREKEHTGGRRSGSTSLTNQAESLEMNGTSQLVKN